MYLFEGEQNTDSENVQKHLVHLPQENLKKDEDPCAIKVLEENVNTKGK